MQPRIFIMITAVFALHQTASAIPQYLQEKPVAVVYTGPGVCDDNCDEAAAAAAEGLGFEIRYLAPAQIPTADLSDVSLWIQPGGNAITAAHALKAPGLAAIRNFIRNGGSYVGFCAGAFLVDKYVDDDETVKGLGVLPKGVETLDYPVDSRNRNGTMVWMYTATGRRHVYFNGGGTFYIENNNSSGIANIVATYGQDGLPATLQVYYGNGNIVVTGAHPEAFQTWKDDGDLTDQDGSDVRMAQDMIELAFQ